MRGAHQSIFGLIPALLLTGVVCGADTAPADTGPVVGGTWLLHKTKISYVGLTSYYTCNGLEDHVRDILISLGARKDAKVRASGCPGGPDRPSATAWIDAEFSTLALTDGAAEPGTVKAHWVAREISPHRPYFMGDGDCELIDQLKQTISTAFAFRNLEYRTDCVPHEIVPEGFKVKGETLVPETSGGGPAR